MRKYCLILLLACANTLLYAQNIQRVEYFWNSDPGFGNATSVLITPDTSINSLMFNADASFLGAGLHVLFIRSQDDLGRWSQTKMQYVYKFPAPNNNHVSPLLTRLEYFIDNDPGFGNGVDIPITSDSVLMAFSFNADVSALASGLHVLNVRSRDANGKWSHSQMQYMYKFPASNNNNVSPLLTKLEYFIDTDPGFGNGVDVPVTNDSILNAFSFNADVSSLASGLHVLYVRSGDATGRWSHSQMQYMYKFPASNNNNVSPQLTKLEYFIDTDPGFGNGVDIPVTNDSILTAFSFHADVSALASGLHVLYVRSLDATGRWSHSQMQYMYKFPASNNNNVSPQLTKLEYFIDNDPGFGNGVDIPVTNDSILTAFSFHADVSALASGLHVLYVRSRDVTGRWSHSQMQYVYKFPASNNNNVSPQLTKLEYFIDNDPGFGNGVDIPVTNDSILTAFSFHADVSALASGLQVLYVRSRDVTGRWSHSQMQYIYKFPASNNNNVSPQLTKLEYFIDDDPGFGNGVDIPFTSDSVVNNVSFNIDASTLSAGTHYLFIRSKDIHNRWSLSKAQRFTRDRIKVFIQGYYVGSQTMQSALYNSGLTNDQSISDTVTVELRQTTFPYTLRASAKGLLSVNGEVTCNLVHSAASSYYLVVKHRNSIETWSAAPVTVGVVGTTYDFTTAANKAYNNNQKQVGSGVWAIYSGDINQDDAIDATDYLILDPDLISEDYGYISSDVNGDGIVDAFDYVLFDPNLTAGITIQDP